MAEKRMFTKKITDDDNFISLSSSAQALYFHLNQGADDDGFNNQITMAMFKAHASEDDLRVLLAKNYIIRFESGVIVIKHWRMHNTLRKDRYTPTNFQEELQMLGVKDNGAYTLGLTSGCQVVANRLPQVSKIELSKDKNRVVEVSGIGNHIDNENDDEDVENSENESFEYVGGKLGKGVVLLTPSQQDALLDKLGLDAFNHYVEKLATFIVEKNANVSSHYNTILKWATEDARI